MTVLLAPIPRDLAPRADAPDKAGDSKIRQVLDGARTVFLRDGFDGASMNDIAREAGVSKGTLYVYFASKDALFAAFVRDEHRRQAEQIVLYGDTDTLQDALTAIGHNFLREMFAPAHIAQVRTVVAAAAKFPEIGRAFYEAGPLYGKRRVAAMLTRHVDDGALEIDDLDDAAVTFFNIVQGDLLKRALFQCETFTLAQIDETVRHGVELFLRLYARRS